MGEVVLYTALLGNPGNVMFYLGSEEIVGNGRLWRARHFKAKSRKYRGIFEEHSPEKKRQVRKKDWSQRVEYMQVPKGQDQLSGGVSVPVGMPHPSQMFYGNLSKFGKRSGRGLSLYIVRSQNVI